jgi:hypothetical protein
MLGGPQNWSVHGAEKHKSNIIDFYGRELIAK